MKNSMVVGNHAATSPDISGTLTSNGGRYHMAAHRTDARFPHVSDMISFQRNMLDETLAAAQRLGL